MRAAKDTGRSGGWEVEGVAREIDRFADRSPMCKVNARRSAAGFLADDGARIASLARSIAVAFAPFAATPRDVSIGHLRQMGVFEMGLGIDGDRILHRETATHDDELVVVGADLYFFGGPTFV